MKHRVAEEKFRSVGPIPLDEDYQPPARAYNAFIARVEELQVRRRQARVVVGEDHSYTAVVVGSEEDADVSDGVAGLQEREITALSAVADALA